MTVCERDHDPIRGEPVEALDGIGDKARLALFPVTDHRRAGRLETRDRLAHCPGKESLELLRGEPLLGCRLHSRQERWRPRDAADRLGWNPRPGHPVVEDSSGASAEIGAARRRMTDAPSPGRTSGARSSRDGASVRTKAGTIPRRAAREARSGSSRRSPPPIRACGSGQTCRIRPGQRGSGRRDPRLRVAITDSDEGRGRRRSRRGRPVLTSRARRPSRSGRRAQPQRRGRPWRSRAASTTRLARPRPYHGRR